MWRELLEVKKMYLILFYDFRFFKKKKTKEGVKEEEKN